MQNKRIEFAFDSDTAPFNDTNILKYFAFGNHLYVICKKIAIFAGIKYLP